MQQIFWNVQEKRAISVVYFGAGLCGWPGIVHGGATATVMDEALGRVAIRLFEARTGVTARLEVGYKRPVRAGGWYVVRAERVPAEEGERDGDGERKMWVRGTLEDLDGRVCVEARGLFVVPRGLKVGVVDDGF